MGISAVRADAQNAMRAIEHVRDSFWKWLGSPDLLSSRAADILFIGQQESLASDSRVLAALLGASSIELPDDDVCAHRNPANIDKTLSPVALANLHRWYEADFRAIELCRQIATRAGFGGSLDSRTSAG